VTAGPTLRQLDWIGNEPVSPARLGERLPGFDGAPSRPGGERVGHIRLEQTLPEEEPSVGCHGDLGNASTFCQPGEPIA
jgi:hypothetical protein